MYKKTTTRTDSIDYVNTNLVASDLFRMRDMSIIS